MLRRRDVGQRPRRLELQRRVLETPQELGQHRHDTAAQHRHHRWVSLLGQEPPDLFRALKLCSGVVAHRRLREDRKVVKRHLVGHHRQRRRGARPARQTAGCRIVCRCECCQASRSSRILGTRQVALLLEALEALVLAQLDLVLRPLLPPVRGAQCLLEILTAEEDSTAGFLWHCARPIAARAEAASAAGRSHRDARVCSGLSPALSSLLQRRKGRAGSLRLSIERTWERNGAARVRPPMSLGRLGRHYVGYTSRL
mmetsp:Transcript_85959/g.208248  ORF Transcript_85959/g.208248 Transcript_85959/m.208248 type:complete len:256 (+) Transcript_85959:599-1366(+)